MAFGRGKKKSHTLGGTTTTTKGDLNARRDETAGTMNLNWRLQVRESATSGRQRRRRRHWPPISTQHASAAVGRVGISSGPTLCARPAAPTAMSRRVYDRATPHRGIRRRRRRRPRLWRSDTTNILRRDGRWYGRSSRSEEQRSSEWRRVTDSWGARANENKNTENKNAAPSYTTTRRVDYTNAAPPSPCNSLGIFVKWKYNTLSAPPTTTRCTGRRTDGRTDSATRR